MPQVENMGSLAKSLRPGPYDTCRFVEHYENLCCIDGIDAQEEWERSRRLSERHRILRQFSRSAPLTWFDFLPSISASACCLHVKKKSCVGSTLCGWWQNLVAEGQVLLSPMSRVGYVDSKEAGLLQMLACPLNFLIQWKNIKATGHACRGLVQASTVNEIIKMMALFCTQDPFVRTSAAELRAADPEPTKELPHSRTRFWA